MAEGTIKRLVSDRGFGFIEPSGGGPNVFFHTTVLEGVGFEDLREGMTVLYESELGDKGPRATVVRPGGADSSRARGYRFLNPYNFVRPLDRPRTEGHVLGNCPPPPHDRYVDGLLTGRITCTVTAVTPLFVSDSHAVEVGRNGHRTFRFFEYGGEPALPASSLRGMIRSVFEAVTNSCFAVFDGKRLSYRLEAGRAAALVPARVEKRDDGTWHLRLLTGFVPLAPGQRPKALYAATLHLYDPIQGKRIRTPKVDLGGLEHGDPCYGLVEKKGVFTYAVQLGRTKEELHQTRDSQLIVAGWVCINNQNVENKRKERFFFRARENTVGPAHIPLPDSVRKAYEDLIADYQERHRDAVDARREAGHKPNEVVGRGRDAEMAFSRYMYCKDDLELGDGTLVYVGLSGTLTDLHVDYIVPAAVPRVSYDHSIADLLWKHLHPCKAYETLCPACRVFGWVYRAEGEEGKPSTGKTVACAGRLRFSHGELVDDLGALEDITLAILSSPKPTTTRFYLRPKKGKPRDGLSDASVGYDGNNVLRGRKLYRHHGEANPVEYERATAAGFDGKDDQNRTVRGARRPGTGFEFTIDFENLAPVELGALLWAIELKENGKESCHRLGLAKPLGFGSVKLETKALECVDPQKRYRTLDEAGGKFDALAQKDAWVDEFRQAMEALYGQPLAALLTVRDLLALLGEPADLPIHYPRVDPAPSPEGKNFEWFMGNKRSGRDAGPRLVLRLAEEDTEGLPLLDKYGRIRG
jgi:CRISPR-associated protein (TIGR03986 family)